MSYFPDIIDMRMRSAYVRCPIAARYEFIDKLISREKNARLDKELSVTSELGSKRRRFFIEHDKSILIDEDMKRYRPVFKGSTPIIDYVGIFELPITHPTTMNKLKLAIYIPMLAVDQEDGSISVIDDRFEDVPLPSLDLDANITSMIWAANQITMLEGISCEVRLPSSIVEVFRPMSMVNTWYQQIVRDFYVLVNVYRSWKWDMRLDESCTFCEYKSICASSAPIEAQKQYQRIQWMPSLRERKVL